MPSRLQGPILARECGQFSSRHGARILAGGAKARGSANADRGWAIRRVEQKKRRDEGKRKAGGPAVGFEGLGKSQSDRAWL